MRDEKHHAPGLLRLLGQIASTGLAILHNRTELLAVEWQEERARLAELMLRTLGFVGMATMGAILLAVTVILLFPARQRVYVTAGLAVLSFLGALATWFGIRALLRRKPFSDSVQQLKQDREWLESLK